MNIMSMRFRTVAIPIAIACSLILWALMTLIPRFALLQNQSGHISPVARRHILMNGDLDKIVEELM